MTNIEKYNNAFVEVFGVEIAVLDDGFSKDSVDAWGFCSSIEYNRFIGRVLDIMFDPEDIMEFTSYGKGREILKKYDVEL